LPIPIEVGCGLSIVSSRIPVPDPAKEESS
jgi:hypothetical protein